ncbi:MAG: glycosyltransferase family 9 protein [Bacteroidaceae bacterium]|nr:glycosyltransferase family 9 protein [Bacteroidaceae bacterium]
MAQNKTPKYKHVLLIRFSAIGDVAMTVPVVYSLAKAFPDRRFTMLSNVRFAPFFAGMPGNVTFMGVDLKKDYHGFGAMFKLFLRLRKQHFDAVADLHGVLRTTALSIFFRMFFTKVKRIDKDRRSRKRLTRLKNKDLTPRLTSFDRYRIVLEKLGFVFELGFRSIFGDGKADLSTVKGIVGDKDCIWVGIAPFAAHKGKIYPLYLMEEVVSQIDSACLCRQFVFAYGKERSLVEEWAQKYRSVEIIDPRLGLQGELALISNMEVMVAMDSSNMHLASITATPVVSVWGATHPAAGFMGWGQNPDNCIQLDLPCRPCSIYGKKECIYSDYRCLTGIDPDAVFAKVKMQLGTVPFCTCESKR